MLTPACQAKLDTCHSVLRRLFIEVAKRTPTAIICGHRGKEEQEQAYKDGKSKAHWGESKHNTNPSLAVDAGPLVGKVIPWDDPKAWETFAALVKAVAAEMKIDLRWGGDFRTFKDRPHWELKI